MWSIFLQLNVEMKSVLIKLLEHFSYEFIMG